MFRAFVPVPEKDHSSIRVWMTTVWQRYDCIDSFIFITKIPRGSANTGHLVIVGNINPQETVCGRLRTLKQSLPRVSGRIGLVCIE